MIGTVTSARIDEPRADPLHPYEGAPTLFHLEVTLDIAVDRIIAGAPPEAIQVRVPVLDGVLDALRGGRTAAERIAVAAPIGASGVFVLRDSPSQWTPVAFEATTGELVAFLRSMDAAVGHSTAVALAESLATSVSGR